MKVVFAAVGAAILAGAVWFFWADGPETQETRTAANAVPPPTTSVTSDRHASAVPSTVAEPAVQPQAQPAAVPLAAPLLHGEAAVDFLQEASTSYDAAQLPQMGNYLTHSDPEVRAAAREAIIQLGAPEGVALLKAAADKTTNAEEAAELRKAADFLALPSWTDQRRKNRAAAPSQK